ncbi:MAG: carbon-nitrogen hydrolase family protein [Anaerolineae bacterium]
METYTVTIGQLVLTHPADVLRQIEQTMLENPETELFAFPEFATQNNVDLQTVPYLQENGDARKEIQRWLRLVPEFSEVQAISDRYGKAMVVGCMAQEKRQVFSRAYVYDPRRRQLASYDKSHVHWTEEYLRPGSKIEPIQTRFGNIGILICYDMAFVEATRVLGLQGAEILIVISAIPKHFHWRYAHYRMIGAAIFNQYYVIAANLGYTPEAPMGGYSGIYSPEGDLIAQIESAAYGSISASVDLSWVKQWREQEKIIPYRKPHLYGALTDP